MDRMGWLRTAVVMVVGSAVVAACGGGDDSLGAPVVVTGTPGTTAVTASTSPATPPTSRAPTIAASGTDSAWRFVTVVDPTRPAVEVRDLDGNVVLEDLTVRAIPTVVVYEGADGGGEDAEPADVDPRPLVIWVKGLGGMQTPRGPILSALVEAGYVVAAPNSPDVSGRRARLSAYREQPGDVTAVLDALLDPSDGVADDLAGLIDQDRIAVAGHSIGASAALAGVFHECCRDDRLDAAVAFGVVPQRGFGDGEFEFAGAPLLLVHGTADRLAPVRGAEAVLAEASPPAFLFEIDGADHFEPVFGDGSSTLGPTVYSIVVEFLDAFVAGTSDPEDLARIAEGSAIGTWFSAEG
jgi:dienelactone hydrolase